jgi:fatty-acyl-CoA synthase
VRASLEGPALVPSPHRTFAEALARAATSDRRLVLVDASEQELALSWAEVRSRARRMAAALMSRGIQPGDAVAMVLPTGRDFLDAFFGAWLAGAVPVPLYPPVRLGRMDEYAVATARMLTLSGARVVLSDRRVRLLLGRALESVAPPLGAPTVAELMEERAEDERAVAPDTLGLIQFSSGSTVDPKPVALTHAQLLAQCAALKQLMPQPEGGSDTGVSWLPLYHDMGLIGALMLAASWPGSLALLPPEAFLARPALWLRAVSRHRGTISPAPNFAYGLCLKRIRDEELLGVDLSCWRYALNGAEPVSKVLMDRFSARFERFGFRRQALMPVYGLSEASLAVTFTAPTGEKRALGVDARRLAEVGKVTPGSRALVSVGRPVPGFTVEVRDEDGQVRDEGQVGRIHARGPSVMREYVGLPEATARAVREGWLDTGDLGFMDQGELFVCGRLKDLVIVRGANHPPQEFEECLEGLPGLRQGCAVALGVVLEETQEEGLVVLAETSGEAPEDLRALVAATIVERTGIKPGVVLLLAPGTLPRTSSGKLRRGEALRRYLADQLTAPRPTSLATVGGELARSALAHARRALKGSGA